MNTLYHSLLVDIALKDILIILAIYQMQNEQKRSSRRQIIVSLGIQFFYSFQNIFHKCVGASQYFKTAPYSLEFWLHRSFLDTLWVDWNHILSFGIS